MLEKPMFILIVSIVILKTFETIDEEKLSNLLKN